MNIEEYVIKECNKLNIKIEIFIDENININGTLCNGHFSHKPYPNIKIAKGSKSDFDYYSLLLHEFCHALQYIENFSKYEEYINQEDPEILIDDWLNYKIELSNEKLNYYVDLLLSIEIDCEKRVLELIQKNNFNINSQLYAMKANSYLLFYYKMKKSRKWYKKAPYLLESIYFYFPKDLSEIVYLDKYDELFELCL